MIGNRSAVTAFPGRDREIVVAQALAQKAYRDGKHVSMVMFNTFGLLESTDM